MHGVANQIYLFNHVFDSWNKNLRTIRSFDYIDIIAACDNDINDDSQIPPIERKNMQAKNVMLVVRIWRKFRQFAQRNRQVLIAQRISSIGIIDSLQFQHDHLTFVGSHTLNEMVNMIGANIHSIKFGETVRDIGEQAHFEFAPHAKKGYHFSNSSPFCLVLLWQLARPLLQDFE